MGNACDRQRKKINIIKFSIPFHAQEKLLVLIIMDEKTLNFRQEIHYLYYRNDPVKYDLKGLKFEGAYMNALSQTLPLGYDFS